MALLALPRARKAGALRGARRLVTHAGGHRRALGLPLARPGGGLGMRRVLGRRLSRRFASTPRRRHRGRSPPKIARRGPSLSCPRDSMSCDWCPVLRTGGGARWGAKAPANGGLAIKSRWCARRTPTRTSRRAVPSSGRPPRPSRGWCRPQSRRRRPCVHRGAGSPRPPPCCW